MRSDLFNDSGPEQVSFRLADLYELARRLRRMGCTIRKVDPEPLVLEFYDPRIRAEARLEATPSNWLEKGWYWDLTYETPTVWTSGAVWLKGKCLYCPLPNKLIRGYLYETRFERRPLKLKKRRRR